VSEQPNHWEEYEATLTNRRNSSSHDAPVRIITSRADICPSKPRGSALGNSIGVVFKNKYLTVVQDRVESSGGSEFSYLRLLSGEFDPAGIAVLPLTSEKKLVLLYHYRHATGAWHWEIPRGYCESTDLEKTVNQELCEELGTSAVELTDLGFVYSNTGLMSERVQLYAANIAAGPLAPTDALEGSMIREIRQFSVKELERMILDGEITDSFTLAAILRAKLQGVI